MATTIITDDTGSALLERKTGKSVILFTAEWHEACAVDGPMDQLLQALRTTFENDADTTIAFCKCDAEGSPKLAERFHVTSVPTFVLVDNATGHSVEQIAGENAAAVSLAVQRLVAANGSHTTRTNSNNNNMTAASTTATTMATGLDDGQSSPKENKNNTTASSSSALTQRLEALLRSSPVMVFIKGSPREPKCGFSRQMIEILDNANIAFRSFDILQDDEVRQGLKVHSNWPTYPQLYVNGELIGGLDIVQEMVDDAATDLARQLGVEKQPSLNERLQALIEQSPVMVFMKGLPSAPRCGFSRQLIELLDSVNAPYDTFDILSDESVRQGLKTYSNWPTFPQLYIQGELIGGLDIAKEMVEDGSLQDALKGIVSSS
jgi:Grx4 family monothiol glutaredoxin